MGKRQRRSRPAKPKRRVTRRRRLRREEEPDLLDRVAAALDDDDPVALLDLASMLLALVDPRSQDPFRPAPADAPTREQFVESFLAVPVAETSALLAAVAALSGDEVLRRRAGREIADRAHALPDWLVGLPRAAAAPDAVEVTHVLGDGDDVLVSVTLPGGHVLTAVVLIEHNLGSIVKDAFVVSEPLDEVVDAVHAAADPDMTVAPLAPADARVRITDAVEHGARTYPPIETETWPAARPLVEWMAGLLPEGGAGYERPEWEADAVDDLARRFHASPFAAGLDDPGDLLSSLLWFGTDYGPGDPMRWSPVSVEIVLLDWIPRKIVAEVPLLAPAPDVLRAFIRFCHAERGIRPGLTDETLAAVDAFAEEYQEIIRTERPQGPAAVLAGLGIFDEEEPDDGDLDGTIREIVLGMLHRAVGGDAALDALDDAPLPDEPFAWDGIAADVHDRVGAVLALVDRFCHLLLDVEHRTACRRVLADVARSDPAAFRGRRKAETAAAAVCWIVGRANCLFDGFRVGPSMQVKELAAHFGVSPAVAQRAAPLLRALGVDQLPPYGPLELGTPRHLVSARRAGILEARARVGAMAQ